jgi:hypothetical protein
MKKKNLCKRKSHIFILEPQSKFIFIEEENLFNLKNSLSTLLKFFSLNLAEVTAIQFSQLRFEPLIRSDNLVNWIKISSSSSSS